jgi:FkbM family methyltransferase
MQSPSQGVVMDRQWQGPAAGGQPQEVLVRFVVDGVAFTLDISTLTPPAARPYKALSEAGELYEPTLTRLITKLVKQMKEPRFMDVGACTGYFTCYVAALLGDARPVYGVESNPIYCERIRRSCELNGQRNVRVLEAVLSSGEEPAVVDRFSVIIGAQSGGGEGATTTTTIALDRLLERESIPAPNLVKVDIHGSEGKAVFGMTNLLRAADYTLLELHGQDRLDEYAAGARRADVMKLMWDLNLQVYLIAGHATNPKQAKQPAIRSGRFAYRRVTPENADCLLFDRLWHQLFMITKNEDLESVLGPSANDPFLVL